MKETTTSETTTSETTTEAEGNAGAKALAALTPGRRVTTIIGLDQSLTNTGVCVLIHTSGNAPTRFTVTTETWSPPLRGAMRLSWFYDRLLRLLSLCRPGETVCAMEGYSFGSTNNREVMGELGGVLKLAAHQAGIAVVIAPPSCVKNFALPTSPARMQTKEEMLPAARAEYGLALPLKKHEHEADAAHLARLTLGFVLGEVSPYPRRMAAMAQLRGELKKPRKPSATCKVYKPPMVSRTRKPSGQTHGPTGQTRRAGKQ